MNSHTHDVALGFLLWAWVPCGSGNKRRTSSLKRKNRQRHWFLLFLLFLLRQQLRTTKGTIQLSNKATRRALLFGSYFNRTLDKLVWICLVRLPHNPFINYTYTQGSEKTKVRTILSLWISALFVFNTFYLNQWAWKSSYTFNVKTFFTLFTYAVASDISAAGDMKCLFILMSCFAWQVIILLFGWWWRITFLKPITWIVKQLTTSLWQNTWCMRWIELFICFIHFLVWFEHHDWAY